MAEGRSEESNTSRRPSVNVDLEEVKFLLSKGFSKTNVAKILGVSRQTLYNRDNASSQINLQKYSRMSTADLDQKVKEIKSNHPNDGEVMLNGHLLSRGIRVPRAKLRASIQRIDPISTAQRRSIAARRRVYHVSGANKVWHIDGNHKLIKWRMVLHGGIDGFSRLYSNFSEMPYQ